MDHLGLNQNNARLRLTSVVPLRLKRRQTWRFGAGPRGRGEADAAASGLGHVGGGRRGDGWGSPAEVSLSLVPDVPAVWHLPRGCPLARFIDGQRPSPDRPCSSCRAAAVLVPSRRPKARPVGPSGWPEARRAAVPMKVKKNSRIQIYPLNINYFILFSNLKIK